MDRNTNTQSQPPSRDDVAELVRRLISNTSNQRITWTLKSSAYGSSFFARLDGGEVDFCELRREVDTDAWFLSTKGIITRDEHRFEFPSSHFLGSDVRLQRPDMSEDFEQLHTLVRAQLASRPEILLQAVLVNTGDRINDGVLVTSVALPWLQIYRELQDNPNFLLEFVGHPRRFEEMIAGAYERAGFDVILTPQSNDGGRDVIASKSGFGSIRFLEQIKAYKPGHLVTHDDVRAMLGVLSSDLNASKCLITTTSGFQPNVLSSPQFAPFIPNRLELKDGDQTVEWLRSIDPTAGTKLTDKPANNCGNRSGESTGL